MTKPTLQIIIGSTRPGRVGPSVAAWIHDRAVKHGGFEVELIDLAEVNLPIFDEPKHPRFGEYVHQHTRDWSATISRGDAYIFVIPEYNYGFNAAIKNDSGRIESLTREIDSMLAKIGDKALDKEVRSYIKDYPSGLSEAHNRLVAILEEREKSTVTEEKAS